MQRGSPSRLPPIPDCPMAFQQASGMPTAVQSLPAQAPASAAQNVCPPQSYAPLLRTWRGARQQHSGWVTGTDGIKIIISQRPIKTSGRVRATHGRGVSGVGQEHALHWFQGGVHMMRRMQMGATHPPQQLAPIALRTPAISAFAHSVPADTPVSCICA